MAISKVWLDESNDTCISCGACEVICPEVFEVPNKMVVKSGVNFTMFDGKIQEAADNCPTEVIKFE